MRKILFVLLFLFSCARWAYAGESDLIPYQKGDWKALLALANERPIAIHLWGVTCAPCAPEMAAWGKFLPKHPEDKVIFLQVDNVSKEMIHTMLARAKLSNANNYYIAQANDEALRYEIDSQWFGETPVTILIDKSGNRESILGPVDFKYLQAWFKKQNS